MITSVIGHSCGHLEETSQTLSLSLFLTLSASVCLFQWDTSPRDTVHIFAERPDLLVCRDSRTRSKTDRQIAAGQSHRQIE